MSDYLYNCSQYAMSHGALLSRAACFFLRRWQTYHEVSLLECLSKSFLPLNTGKSHGRTSIHKPKQKAKGFKKELLALAQCYKNSPLFIHKITTRYTRYLLELFFWVPSKKEKTENVGLCSSTYVYNFPPWEHNKIVFCNSDRLQQR